MEREGNDLGMETEGNGADNMKAEVIRRILNVDMDILGKTYGKL